MPELRKLVCDFVTGFGTTVEAGLVVRQLLRRREYSAVLAAPPGMTLQWQDELVTKFGLAFHGCDYARPLLRQRSSMAELYRRLASRLGWARVGMPWTSAHGFPNKNAPTLAGK